MLKFLRALLGDAEAQRILALEYWYGPAEKRNQTWAIYWARRAARNGPPVNGLLLATILFEAKGPAVASPEFMAAFERGAAAGDSIAQNSLGWAYEQGEMVPRDLEKALYWYTRAAANGDTESEEAVARLCREAPAN